MPAEGGERTRLTTMPGNHRGLLSPDEKWIADIYSYTNKPPELYVMPNQARAEEKKLTSSPAPEFWTYPWLDVPIVHIRARDGVEVPAHLYKPADFKKGGPAVIFVHGAGYLQNVHRWWSDYYREYMFHHMLMERGYIVIDLDYRGSAGYGRDWRTAIYRHMGGVDLDDQVDAAKWLASQQGVDPKRIGIYGGSYGGFITLMAMFKDPGVFAAGAALRPVTDWANYNNGYTSNILNTPQKDEEAYKKSSPIYFADGLKGALLICHGMVDTNVHFQDTVHAGSKTDRAEKRELGGRHVSGRESRIRSAHELGGRVQAHSEALRNEPSQVRARRPNRDGALLYARKLIDLHSHCGSFMSLTSPGAKAPIPKYAWYRDLNRYQWFVLAVASMGWMFDTMAQQLFNIARVPAIRELMGVRPTDQGMAGAVSAQAAYATMVFMIGWALGGIIFGILGDRVGRAKTMVMTILMYSVFTGISVFAVGLWDFNIYRFLCGLGVGGQFAVGVALVAETVPDRARPYALGMLQALSAVGNMMAAMAGIILGQIELSGAIIGRMAVGVSGRRASCSAGAVGIPQAEGARAVAAKPRGKEAHGFVRRIVLAIPDGGAIPLSACCWPSPAWLGCGGSGSSASTCCVRYWRRPSAPKALPGRRLPAEPRSGSASHRCCRIWAPSSA